MKSLRSVAACAIIGIAVLGCQGQDSDTATSAFVECLERNGVVAEDVEVTMSGGSIEGISLLIVSEGDVPYEPTVRLACSEEVENQ